MTKKVVVLGLDLSLNGTGAVVVECDGFSVKILDEVLIDNKRIASKETGMKLFNIYYEIETLLDKYSPWGEIVVVKEKGFSMHNKATQALYKVAGVLDLLLFIQKMVVDSEYAPTTVKKVITGRGKATKEEVREEVTQYLVSSQESYNFKSDDTSDALAVAVTYLISEGYLEKEEN
jgi:crossover junction endodeoxyribonuclease RuvC